MEEKAKKNGKKNKILSIVILILALVYGVSPVDIIPDMPVVGWADDFFIIAFAVLNMLQFSSDDNHREVGKMACRIVWHSCNCVVAAYRDGCRKAVELMQIS